LIVTEGLVELEGADSGSFQVDHHCIGAEVFCYVATESSHVSTGATDGTDGKRLCIEVEQFKFVDLDGAFRYFDLNSASRMSVSAFAIDTNG